MAAAAMWTIWIVAYVTGMSSLALMPRGAPAAEMVGSAMDRQMATTVGSTRDLVGARRLLHAGHLAWRAGHAGRQAT
jgi:hypothetical protein